MSTSRTAGALRRLAVAEARRRPGRVVVTVLTVALGAGALTTALVLGDSVETAVADGASVEFKNTDVIVRSEIAAAEESAQTLLGSPSTSVAPENVAAVAALPDVEAVASTTRAAAVARTGDLARGISLESLATDTRFQWQGWSAGRPPKQTTEIALSQHTLDELLIGLGDQVQIGHPGVGYANFTVVGVVDTRGSLTRQSSAYGIVLDSVAARLAGIEGSNTILIDAADGADLDEVVAGVNEKAPVGWPQKTSDLISSSTDVQGGRVAALGAVVAVLAGVSCLVAAITAATTTVAGLATRRRTWALARCIGANRWHVAGLVTVEALLLGAVGAVGGVLGGLLVSRLALPLVGLVPSLPPLQGSSFTVHASSVVVPLLVAAGLALLGALLPAWLAARISPQAALRETRTPQGRSAGLVRLVVGVVLTALGTAAALLGADDTRLWLIVGGVAAMLLGAGLLLTPLLALLARLLAGWAGSAAVRIGLRDVVQRPRPAATEAVAVALAVGMIAMSWVALASIQEATSARLSDSPMPDLTVGAPDGAGVVPKEAVEYLREIDGVDTAVQVDHGVDVTVEGQGETGHVSLSTGVVAGNAAQLGRALPHGFPVNEIADDTVYLPEVAFPPFTEGSRVTLKGPDGASDPLKVVYIEDFELPAVVSPATMETATEKSETRMVWIALADGADRTEVADEITGVAILAGQLPVTGPVITDIRIGEALSTARAAAVAILVVAVIVAAVGAAATASLSVSERAREHAVLRALGLPRASLGRLLTARVLFVGAVASLLGVVVGTLVGIVASRAVAVGLGLPPQVSWLVIAPVLVVALITVLLIRTAALVPMERASYIPPSRALARG
ncbi:MAG: ABC transporter permease [Aeromicrobium sp.]|uniref:ABC transporter permease n=1 Tax=Aeromicrobium sp. TaxID=1871063 RepID=UPI0039E48C9B